MNTTHTLGALAAGVLLTGLAIGGAAAADDAPAYESEQIVRTDRADRTQDTEQNGRQDRTSVDEQHGIVIEATSDSQELPVFLSLYENDLHGNSIQVILGDPELDVIGSLEQAEPFVVDGRIDVTVEIDGKPARLTGTVVETGTTRMVDPLQDGGEQLVQRGTHTMLDADLAITYDGLGVELDEAPAFAYDLETRRVTLYGN